jgi:hypothetical protein
MGNRKSNSNALFLIVISLFILIFIIVSYVIVSGSIFDENSNSESNAKTDLKLNSNINDSSVIQSNDYIEKKNIAKKELVDLLQNKISTKLKSYNSASSNSIMEQFYSNDVTESTNNESIATNSVNQATNGNSSNNIINNCNVELQNSINKIIIDIENNERVSSLNKREKYIVLVCMLNKYKDIIINNLNNDNLEEWFIIPDNFYNNIPSCMNNMNNMNSNTINKSGSQNQNTDFNSYLSNVDKNAIKDIENALKSKYRERTNSKEVFNIRDNSYNYDQAKAICAAHNSRLATLEELIKAYKKGANWCSYGWTQGQLALYPTQKDFWEKLQNDPKTKNQCGEVGINGGYFENLSYKFGANCYGVKPNPKGNEIEKNPVGKRLTKEDQLVKEYKSQLDTVRISPFNDSLPKGGKWFSP